MRKSLELNWLHRYSKHLPTPELVFVDGMEDKAGFYVWPDEVEFETGGKCYKANNGLICISTVWPENIPEVLAHEWRHHWQYCTFGYIPEWPYIETEDYEYDTYRYFSAWHEMDAELFAHRKHPTEWSEWWLDLMKTYRPEKTELEKK